MKYRKKPVEIEAIQWNGENVQEVKDFLKNKYILIRKNKNLIIATLEGNMLAKSGDFIIKGVQGEFYPCKPDIFWQTYEKTE